MKLRDYLFEYMLTQQEFADKIGCTRNYISMISRGKYPGPRIARRIAEATGQLVRYNRNPKNKALQEDEC